MSTDSCAGCKRLDPKPIDSGARYCFGEMHYRLPSDVVEGCGYRDEPWIAHELRRGN